MNDTPVPSNETPRDLSVQSGFVCNAAAEHDVTMTTSVAGIVNTQGDATVNQGGACAVVAQGNVSVKQGGAGIVTAQSFSADGFGGGVVVSHDAHISKGWVGVALSPNMEVSDDSRVIIGPKAAAIMVIAMFGVFGLVAVLGVMAARKAAQWRPKIPTAQISWRRMGE